MNRLRDKYLTEVKPALKTELGLNSDLAVPALVKVVINIGSGEIKDNEDLMKRLQTNLSVLSGQKSVVTRARKSIASFKLTKGSPIGLMVTLRGEKMYAFLDKLINTVLPKVRDFRGVSDNSFDSRGNFNLGLREQTIFPEVEKAVIESGSRDSRLGGLQITITTTAKDRVSGKNLLEKLGMPFMKGAS